MPRFLNEAKAKPWQWGVHDCLMWLADWIAIKRGFDVAAEWRDTYRTPFGAQRIMAEVGGMIPHVDRCVAPFGIIRTASPKQGDIVIVDPMTGDTGAIMLGKTTVALLTERGLVFAALPIKAAWSV